MRSNPMTTSNEAVVLVADAGEAISIRAVLAARGVPAGGELMVTVAL